MGHSHIVTPGCGYTCQRVSGQGETLAPLASIWASGPGQSGRREVKASGHQLHEGAIQTERARATRGHILLFLLLIITDCYSCLQKSW